MKECKHCSGEEQHECECGTPITQEECTQYEGYCSDTCIQKFCK